MPRRTFDALASAAGLVLAAVLLAAAGLLLWGHSFVDNQVSTQLTAQKIVFPTKANPEFKAGTAHQRYPAGAIRQGVGNRLRQRTTSTGRPARWITLCAG